MLTCGFPAGQAREAPGPPFGVHVRILIDYRPALRQRSGVGEYIFRLLQALRQVRQPGDELAIFSSSWKDRVDRRDLDGIGVVDARIPVKVLNRLWHRQEWPPVGDGRGAASTWSTRPGRR